jgi:hypothetical protein
MVIKEQIKEQLENKFVCGDNFSRNFAEEKRIKHENSASIAIELALKTNKMNSFLGKVAKGAKLPISPPIVITRDAMLKKEKHNYQNKTTCETIRHENIEFEHSYFSIKDGQLHLCQGKVKYLDEYMTPEWQYILDNYEYLAHEAAKSLLTKKSYCNLFSQVTRYNTPEKIIKFFKPEFFRSNGCNLLSKDFVLDTEMLPVCSLNSMQEFEEYFNRLPVDKYVNYIPELTVSDWYRSTYVFNNEDGAPVQYILKPLWANSASKSLIPCSGWIQESTAQRRILQLPASGLQILYNLDLISQVDQPTVILTDSLELAESNQRFAPDGVVWTSFLCDENEFDQVDWTPLKNTNEIYYLITNHSGISLAEAYVKAELT